MNVSVRKMIIIMISRTWLYCRKVMRTLQESKTKKNMWLYLQHRELIQFHKKPLGSLVSANLTSFPAKVDPLLVCFIARTWWPLGSLPVLYLPNILNVNYYLVAHSTLMHFQCIGRKHSRDPSMQKRVPFLPNISKDITGCFLRATNGSDARSISRIKTQNAKWY